MDIVKVGEIVIKFPSFDKKTIPFVYTGFLPQSFGVMLDRYILFKKDYDYFHIDMVNNTCKKICGFGFEPGKTIYFPESLGLSDRNEFTTSDMLRRINIYNENGDFKESYVLPVTLGGSWVIRKFRDMIIKSYDNVSALNLNTGVFKDITNFRFEDIDKTDENVPRLVNSDCLLFDITPDGNLIVVRPLEPYVYEFSTEGELINKYEEIPPNYVSFYDIESYKRGEKIISRTWDQDQKEDQLGWFDKWSFSGSPYVFKKDYFVVPRRVYPPIFLDFYSLKTKKYIGQCNIENKTLLYADKKYIYLHKDSGDKEFIVEKFEVNFNSGLNQISATESIYKSAFTITEQESVYDPNKNQYKLIHEKEYRKTEEIASIINIAIKDLNEKDFPLINILNKEKKYHFIINARVLLDCGLPELIADVEKFCGENSDFDYYLIYTHPYKEELKRSLKFFKFNVDPIFNIDPERILSFYSKSDDSLYPSITISLVDNNGNFVCAWKDDNFFKDVSKKFGLG